MDCEEAYLRACSREASMIDGSEKSGCCLKSQTRCLSARTFLQCVSEQSSFRTPLQSGWTRVSVPNPGRVSVITEPAPEKRHSPQGPVAHFYKEPKMLLAFAKLFFLSVPPPVWRLHCRDTCHHLQPCIFTTLKVTDHTQQALTWCFACSISSLEPGCQPPWSLHECGWGVGWVEGWRRDIHLGAPENS